MRGKVEKVGRERGTAEGRKGSVGGEEEMAGKREGTTSRDGTSRNPNPAREEEMVKPMLVTSSVQTVEMRQEERGIQTEADVLVEAMEKKKNRKKGKGKERRKDEDTVMKDGSGDLDTNRYQD